MPAFGAHRAAQQVGLVAVDPADGHRHLHQLFLEQRHPHRPLEDRLEFRVQVGDGFLAGPAPDVGVDRAALDRAGADQGDLGDQVVEPARQQPGQGGHLGAGLDLEHPDGIAAAELVVDAGFFFRDGVQRPLLAGVLTDQVDAVLQGGEHPEAEEVELDQAHPGAVVLVPLQHRPFLLAGVLDRHHLPDRPLGQHHPAGVDPEVPRELQQLGRQRGDAWRDVTVSPAAGRDVGGPAVDVFRPGVLLADGVAEGFGGVADRGLRPVGDDVGDLGGVTAPVLAVDVLDDFFAAVGVEVDIDVGFLGAGRGQEPLERQPVQDAVHRGDLQRVTDRGVRRRSPALVQDPLCCGRTGRCRKRSGSSPGSRVPRSRPAPDPAAGRRPGAARGCRSGSSRRCR